MKKALAILGILVLPVLVSQSVSLWQFSRLRNWFASRSTGDIVVGVAWPFAANEDGFDKGLLLARDEINAHGVRGRRFRLEMRDDALDRNTSRNAAIDFARSPKMVATIGYYDDSSAVRASAIFEESKLLHIVAGANNTYMTTHGFRYLIRSVLSNNLIGRKVARLCADRGYRNFAIIAEDGPFGDDLAYQFGTELDSLDARVVYSASYVRSMVDFRESIDELRGVGADVILFAGLETEGAKFIRAARGMGLSTPIVGSFSDTPEMHRIAGPLLNGVMFYEIYDVNRQTPENRAFVAKFRRRFGEAPGPYAAQGYDALHILAMAVEKTGSVDPLDLAYAIRYMDRWEGANGSYKFDGSGELEDKPIYLEMYKGDKPSIIAAGKPLSKE